MYTIGLISDTHVPSRSPAVPERVLALFRHEGVEEIIHAGDLTRLSVIDELETVAPVVAVKGNMDPPAVGRELASFEKLTREGHAIGVMHGSGGPSGFIQRVYDALPAKAVEVVVCGHTHNHFIESYEGILFINPGSPTDTVHARQNTVGTLTLAPSAIHPRIHTLPD